MSIFDDSTSHNERLQQWFSQGRQLLKAGKVTQAHKTFAQIAEINANFPDIGHALAVSLPNSFLVKIEGQLDVHNADYANKALDAVLNKYAAVKLLLLDLSDCTYISSSGISVLRRLQARPNLAVKVLELHPRAKQVITHLKMDKLIWNDTACPICGPANKVCRPRFARRRRHSIVLPKVD